VSIPRIALSSNERIVGFAVHVQSGRIAQLPKLPIGWTISVDNDPSWRTSLEGPVTVGAASLGTGYFRSFLVIEADKNAIADMPLRLTGEVVVTSDFVAERHMTLSQIDFATRRIGTSKAP
jgi:hypothetical protein